MSFVSSSGNGNTSSSVVVTAPSGIQDDDILVCFVAAYKAFGNPPITLPSGFTEWYERECTEYNTAIGWKRADSESGNYTVSATGADSMYAGICVYRGRVASGDPCDVKSDTPYTTSDTNVRAAGVTITDEGADLIYAGWVYNGVGESDPGLVVPSGMTSRIAVAYDYTGIAMGDLLDQSTGTTGNKDGTHDSPNSGDFKHAFLVALKPAAASAYEKAVSLVVNTSVSKAKAGAKALAVVANLTKAKAAAGGKVVSTTVNSTLAKSRASGKVVSLAVSAALSKTKAAGKAFSNVVNATLGLAVGYGFTKTVSLVVNASVSGTKAGAKLLSGIVSTALSKTSAGAKAFALVCSATPSVVKAAAKVWALTVSAALSLAAGAGPIFVKTVSLVVNITPAFSRAASVVRSLTVGATLSVSRAAATAKSITVNIGSTIQKAAGKVFSLVVEIARTLDSILDSIFRPAVDHRWLRLFSATDVLLGVVLADVDVTYKLTAPNEIQGSIPWEYLLQDGTLESRVEMLDDAWYVEYDGGRYVVTDMDTDSETAASFAATSAEVDDLSNVRTNYSGGPATYINMLPSVIAQRQLSGQIGRYVRNAGFGILDEDDLPTNWTHPAGWTSETVSSRLVWQADAGSDESLSDAMPCELGGNYRAAVDIKAPVGMTGTVGIKLRWYRDGAVVSTSAATTLATIDGAFHSTETGDLEAQGTSYRIVLYTDTTSAACQFDDVRAYEIGTDSGYTYTGELDARDAEIPCTDGAIERTGVWTFNGTPVTDIYSTGVGDTLTRIINGPWVLVSFAAGGAGAEARVYINGVQYEASGSALVPGSTDIDVSAAVELTASGLDPQNDHIVTVEVAAVKTSVIGFEATTENLISMRWDDKSVYEAIHSIAKAVGGELEIDPVAKTVYHHAERGQDLTANNVVEFRRGSNIVGMRQRKSTGPKVVNRLICCGYGEGEYMIRCTVDATDTDADGDTSQDVYGVKRGLYENKECKSLATLREEGRVAVAKSQWPQKAYTVEVSDAAAALCEPGDTGHFVYRTINEHLRILEIKRRAVGGSAQLVVARRSDDVADYIVATERSLATLNRSYQGVPSDANMYFSEIFDRFGGVDIAAEIPFFLPYGSDLLKLWLTYEIGGMRATAKGAESGGGQTSSSGGGQTTSSGGGQTTSSGGGQTTSSGGSSTPTSSSQSTPSGGGSTSGSTAQDVVSSAGTSRSVENNTSDAWATVAAQAINATTYTTQHVLVGIFNRSGGSRTFNVEIGTSYGASNVGSPTPIVAANGVTYVVYILSSGQRGNSIYARVKPGTTSNSSYDITIELVGYAPHTHSTPNHTHPAHDHTVTIAAHTHTVSDHTHTVSNHTHTVSDHTHTVSNHTHNLDYGINESAMPTGLRVYVDDTLVTDLNDVLDISKVDLLPYVRKDTNGRVAEGRHTLSFTTPNNDETGSVRGTLYISKFLSVEAA